MVSASLVRFVPVLQLSAPLDDRGCARLLASMDNPTVSAWAFQYLSLGRATQGLQDQQLAELLQRLSIKPDGLGVAIAILYMHIHDNPKPVGPLVTNLARALIASAPLTEGNQRLDNELAGVIRKFAVGSDGELAARRLLTRIRERFESLNLSRYDLSESLAALFQSQPFLALDVLVGDAPVVGHAYRRRHALTGGRRSGALSKIPVEALVQWCRDGPTDRWVHVAPLVPAFAPSENPERLLWSDRVLALLQNAPEPANVAESLVELIEPMSWSGSRAEAIRGRLPLLDQLAHALGPEHADRVAAWKAKVMLTVEREARRDLEEHRTRNERFE